MKAIECGGVVPGCDYVARAETEEEVVAVAARHAKAVHGISVSPAVAAKARRAIRED